MYIKDNFLENLEQLTGNRLTIFYFYSPLIDEQLFRISEEKVEDEIHLQQGDTTIMIINNDNDVLSS